MELKNYVAQWAGEVLPSAVCYLYPAGTETLATGLQDANGTALPNPFLASNQGLIQFAAPNGKYDLRVTNGGRESRMRVQCLDVEESIASAQVAAVRAETARDATFLNADVYSDVATGRSSVADGQQFQVLSGDASELIRYRRDSPTTHAEVARYPSASRTRTDFAMSVDRAHTQDLLSDRVGYGGWFYTDVDFPAGQELGRHTLRFRSNAAGAVFRYKAWLRPLSNLPEAGSAAVGIGDGANDQLVVDFTAPFSALGVVAGGAVAAIAVTYPVPVRVPDGFALGFEVWAETAAGLRVVVGMGVRSGEYLTPRRLWFRPTTSSWASTTALIDAGTLFRAESFFARQSSLIGAMERVDATAAAVSAQAEVIGEATQTLDLLRAVSVIGRADEPMTGSSSGARTYLMHDPLPSKATIRRVRVHGSGSWTFRRFKLVDGIYQAVGSAVTVALASGLNDLPASIFESLQFQPDEMIGFYVASSTGIRFTSNPANGAGWSGTLGDVTAISQPALQTTLRLEVSIEFNVLDLPIAASVVTGPTTQTPLKFAGCLATKLFGGRLEFPFNNATPHTFRTIFSVAQEFDWVRVVFGHGNAQAVSINKFAVAPLATADYDAAAANWTAGAFAGSASGLIPPRPGTRRAGLLVSDWIRVSSLPRTDNAEALPLLAVSAYMDTTGSVTMLGNVAGTDNFSNWAAHPTRPHVMRYNAGDCVASPAAFVDTANRSTSPIIGLQYRARGQVVTVFAVGDSITDGRGDYLMGNWAFRACNELSNKAGVAYEYGNMGWSGCTTAQMLRRTEDYIAAGLVPDVGFVAAMSPNDISGPITDAALLGGRQNTAAIVDLWERAGSRPVLWTWLPTNTSVRDYGGTDAKRTAFNAQIRAQSARGRIVVDFDAVIAGESSSAGQVQMLAASTSDGIHPNDAGEELMKPLAKAAIQMAAPLNPGGLIVA